MVLGDMRQLDLAHKAWDLLLPLLLLLLFYVKSSSWVPFNSASTWLFLNQDQMWDLLLILPSNIVNSIIDLALPYTALREQGWSVPEEAAPELHIVQNQE